MSTSKDTRERSYQVIQQACDRLSPLGKIYSRSQFGGYGLCCEEAMFALVADGELYLRSNQQLSPYFNRKGMRPFVYEKRGLPVSLQYYRVDEQLWSQQEELLSLASQALDGAQQDRQSLAFAKTRRIKDLTNLDLAMERKLWRVGITDPEKLKQYGAIKAYLLLEEKIARGMSVNVLLALHGAIKGCHVAVLPECDRASLLDWWQEYSGNRAKR